MAETIVGLSRDAFLNLFCIVFGHTYLDWTQANIWLILWNLWICPDMLFIFVPIYNACAMAKKALTELGLGVCPKPCWYDVRWLQWGPRCHELLITRLMVLLVRSPMRQLALEVLVPGLVFWKILIKTIYRGLWMPMVMICRLSTTDRVHWRVTSCSWLARPCLWRKVKLMSMWCTLSASSIWLRFTSTIGRLPIWSTFTRTWARVVYKADDKELCAAYGIFLLLIFS